MILLNKIFNNVPGILSKDLRIEESELEYRVETDSRKVDSKSIFIALEGEKYDGFTFIDEKLCQNVAGIVYRSDKQRDKKLKELQKKIPHLFCFGVRDTTHYIQELSRLNLEYWIERCNGSSIAITGSNGKTTNKDMITHILNTFYPERVHYTWKNFNNHIGVPLTLLDLKKEHQFLVLEMGTNHPGEIERLCEIAFPSSGYITNIGDSHLEFFKHRENVFKEKSALYKSCRKYQKSNSIFMINSDDPYLSTLAKEDFCKTIGESKGSDYLLTLFNDHVNIESPEGHFTIQNNMVIGRHNYRNFAMAACMVREITGKSFEELVKAAESFVPQNNRSELHHIENQTIFLDAYNANPSSMRSAIESYVEYISCHSGQGQKSLFVLGDMNELGDQAETAHAQIATYIEGIKQTSSFSIDIIYVGRYAQSFAQGLADRQSVNFYENRESLAHSWDHLCSNYSFLFIKASRSLQLELLIGIN